MVPGILLCHIFTDLVSHSHKFDVMILCTSRGGSRFSGKGFKCIKVWGFALLILSHFS